MHSKHITAHCMMHEALYLTYSSSGMPTSMEDSGQQWDFPNAWAPLQHLAIMGLYEARNIHHAAEELSFDLAEKWIRTNWKGYQELNAMFEKV